MTPHWDSKIGDGGEGRVGKEDIPGGVEVEPALGVEPTGGELGDVEETVAAGADEFGAVPGEEAAGGLADACRVCEFAEADGAAAALIAETPTEAEEAYGEGGDDLDVVGSDGVDGGAKVGEIDGEDEDERQEEDELGGEVSPAADAGGPGERAGADAVLAEGERGGGGEGEECEEDGEEEDA